MRIVLALIPLLALAACGGGGDKGNTAAAVPTAAPVANSAPPAGKQWTDVVTKTADGGFRMGNPDAPIKLVEYGSRGCPFCKHFFDTEAPLRDKYVASGRVSFEFRDFLIHPQDAAAAVLGQCSGADAFFPILDAMYQNQEAIEQKLQTSVPKDYQQILASMNPQQSAAWWAQQAGLIQFMQQRGMPAAKAQQCLADKTLLDGISQVVLKAQNDLGVTGTPTFFINGAKVENIGDFAQLEPLLKNAGAR